MKKIIFLILFSALFSFYDNTASAQCTISDLGVNVKSFNSSTCQVVFDFTWVQEVNGGNKYAYLHLWFGNAYHTPAASWTNMYSNPTSFPKLSDLTSSLGTIAIYENSSVTPFIGNTYLPDPTVTPLTTGLTIIKTPIPDGSTEQMTVKNISLTLPNCAGIVNVKADVWASQASNGKNVHCDFQGLNFNLNNPRAIGFKVCNPRSVTFGISNNDPVIAITINWNLYKDDGDGVFEPGIGQGRDGIAINSKTNITIASSTTYSEFQFPFNGSKVGGETGSLWLEVFTVVPAYSFATIAQLSDPGCIPLPVDLVSFTAQRIKDRVLIKWETASELNCSGFVIERSLDNITWKDVVFVASKALAGNSSELLFYQYNDINNSKSISQYRIRQVDINKNQSYSAVRSVKGIDQKGNVIIFPNPAVNGSITIFFEDINSPKEIVLLDMNGRVMQKYHNILTNNFKINNLRTGMYLIRVIDMASREEYLKKILVSNL